MSRVELKGLAKRYGPVEAIRRIDLAIEDGEFVVFVGPSGCGKSTLLRLICGLDLPTEGEILFDGKNMRSVPPSRRKLAMVFQSYALYPHLTVADNMGFALRMSGVPKAERAARVAKAAETLQIAALLSRLPKELSGGQRQRVAIGRAIVREPSVFLFDEPLSNLDAELRVEMRAELETMHRRLKATMIFVTHDQIEAMTLADRIVVMHSGVVEQVGSPVELYERPANRFVANFIGSPHMNFLKGRVMARTERAVVVEVPGVSPQRLTLPLCSGAAVSVDESVAIGVRPDAFTFEGPAEATLDAPIEFIEYVGGGAYVRSPNHSVGPLTIRHSGRGIAVGTRLRAGFDMQACHVFDAGDQRLSP